MAVLMQSQGWDLVQEWIKDEERRGFVSKLDLVYEII